MVGGSLVSVVDAGLADIVLWVEVESTILLEYLRDEIANRIFLCYRKILRKISLLSKFY